jgi:hypothetical protein
MKFMEGWYSEYSCDVCGNGNEGERWHCPDHEADICPSCGPECPQASADSTPGTTRQVSSASGASGAASVPRTPSAVSVTGAGAPLPEKRHHRPDSETSSQRSQVSVARYEIPSTRQTSAASFREPVKPVNLGLPNLNLAKVSDATGSYTVTPRSHITATQKLPPAMPKFGGMPELPGIPSAPTAFCDVGQPHPMKLSVGKYSNFACDRCGGRLNEGERWHCSEHQVDVCLTCHAKTPVVKAGPGRREGGIGGLAKVLVLLALLLPFYHIVEHRRQVSPQQPPQPQQPQLRGSGRAARPSKEPEKEAPEKPKEVLRRQEPRKEAQEKLKAPESKEPRQKTDAEIQREIEDKAARLHKQALAQQARRHAAMRGEKKGWWAA